MALSVSACGLVGDYEESQRTVGEQCDRTRAFFSATLRVTGAEIRWSDYDSSEAVGKSAYCVLWSDSSVLIGSTMVWALRKGETARAHISEDPLFRPLDGYGNDVWLKRDLDGTRFAVVAGRWQGDLTVNTGRAFTAEGQLEMSEELERQSVEFLIELTEYIGS
ncbi:hypothetical protein [Nocardia sp. NPDC005366]|uniref:hypothetical protein n=1 Tax=Nocardia sp. NPDC005366 TaxID=3156878 RepID=UPI0033ADC4AD